MIDLILAKINELHRPHYICEDCFYSCPKSDEGSCNHEELEDKCTCGADAHNAKVDALIRLVEDYEDGL